MRQPKPFFKASRDTWYVQIGKKQINLGSDQEKAFEQYHSLMSAGQTPSDGSTALHIITKFLAWSKAHSSPGTHAFYFAPCESFCEYVGSKLKAADLKKHHLTGWIDAKFGKISSNYKRNLMRAIQRPFNWATEEGYIEASPLAKVKKPLATPREVILTTEQWGELVAAIEARGERARPFLELCWFLRHTGCRPLEARSIEAKNLDRKNKCIEFGKDEPGKLGSRVVPLTDAAFALCCRLAAKYPTGPLLRNEKGMPWKCRAVTSWFERLSGDRIEGSKGRGAKRVNKPSISFSCTPYAVRHTFATDAIERGVDLITIATLMGHKDLKQLMKTYQHMNKKSDHLRKALLQALPENVQSSAAFASRSA